MPTQDSPNSLSVGLAWASRISTLSLEFAVPAVAGYYLDRYLDTAPVATLGGAILGFLSGFIHLIRIAKAAGPRASKP